MRIVHCTRRWLMIIALTSAASTGYGAAIDDARPVSELLHESPSVAISNGSIDATVALPDPKSGFYRGTRFDWSGMITKLCRGGQRFYGPWFDQVSPTVRDFAYDGDTLVASTASAATGPAEEFDPLDNPLGYDAAKAGDTFIKIGVGVLRRPDLNAYDHYRAYEIVDHGQWHSQKMGRGSVIFTQQLSDPRSGYAYRYVKRIELLPGTARMIIAHTLTNRGKLTIRSTFYDHNFLTLDGNPTQAGLKLETPFAIVSDVTAANATLAGKQLTLARSPPTHESIAFSIAGFGPSAADYRFAVTSADQRSMVSVSSDAPIAKVAFWSIPRVVAAEPYIHIDVAAGQSVKWRYLYDYRAEAGTASDCHD
jgi:hypothetical protein